MLLQTRARSQHGALTLLSELIIRIFLIQNYCKFIIINPSRNRLLGKRVFLQKVIGKRLSKVFIHLLRTQNFRENLHFLPLHTQTSMYLLGRKKC